MAHSRINTHMEDAPSAETSFLHEHPEEHELVWHIQGSMFVESDGSVWEVLPGTAIWIPAGARHRLCGRGEGRFGWAKINIKDCPSLWLSTRLIETSSLARQLLMYLMTDVCIEERLNAEAVVFDLLQAQLSVPDSNIAVPADTRCQQVAHSLLADPTCDRSLIEWGLIVGASARTLSRIWHEETGLTFAEWRALVRLRVAVAALGSGLDVGSVARTVGYQSSSAFVAAFRRQTGRTPQSYLDRLDLCEDEGVQLQRVG